MTIAVAKWIGTLAPTIVFGVHEDSVFILTLGLLCSAVDLAYIALLAGARRDATRLGAGSPAEFVPADQQGGGHHPAPGQPPRREAPDRRP